MTFSTIKNLFFGDIAKDTPVVRGPFRGATFHGVPKASMRKILGLYEHELNDWIAAALPRVRTVLDVGANDGYFTFGCAAAFRRLHRAARLVSFDPDPLCCAQLKTARERFPSKEIEIDVQQTFVGAKAVQGCTTLSALPPEIPRREALIKIDVEGAEMDVLDGAEGWITPENYFLIEVHKPEYVAEITERFAKRGLTLQCRRQRPLPLLGRELREESNCWLVSALS